MRRRRSAVDLLDWHPHIRREPDPRQASLPLEPPPIAG
jgi:hypothetical protein